MPTSADTQAYLTETKSPSVTVPTVKTTLKSIIVGIGNYQQELAKEMALASAALYTETDSAARAQLTRAVQNIGALQREMKKLADQILAVQPPLDDWVTNDANFRTNAEVVTLGYTV